MSQEPYSLPWVFDDYHADHPNASPLVSDVVECITAESLNRTTLDEILKKHGDGDIADVKADLCGLLLYYAQLALDDHRLQANEISNMKHLKTMLRVGDGEVYEFCPDQLQGLLYAEMAWALEDFEVSEAEELKNSELQGALGLSYDQFMAASRAAIADARARIEAEIDGEIEGFGQEGLQPLPMRLRWFIPGAGSAVPRQAALRATLAGLEAWEWLATGPGRVRKEGSAGREIPQSVKEQVWRRDNGRCVVCGSQQGLEYDHIIPFSRGGASTFRNVQLLCESCNRKKSARIGG